MRYACLAIVLSIWPGYCGPAWSGSPAGPEDGDGTTAIKAAIPTLNTDNPTIDKAFRIAIGDLLGNVVLYKAGLLEQRVPVILAGLDYSTPWTRDASINAWNGASLIIADVCRNTLLACVIRADGVRFQPCVPKGISHVELRNVNYRSMNLDLTIWGTGTTVKQCLINGREVKDGLLDAGGAGRKQVVITLSER
jgi:hypothetical protein